MSSLPATVQARLRSASSPSFLRAESRGGAVPCSLRATSRARCRRRIFVSDPCETSRGRHCVQTSGPPVQLPSLIEATQRISTWTDAVTTIAAGRRRARFATEEPAGFRSVTWVVAAKVGPVGAHPSALRRRGHYSDAGRLRFGRPAQYTRLRDQEWSGRASHPVATVPGSGLALSVAPGPVRRVGRAAPRQLPPATVERCSRSSWRRAKMESRSPLF